MMFSMMDPGEDDDHRKRCSCILRGSRLIFNGDFVI